MKTKNTLYFLVIFVLIVMGACVPNQQSLNANRPSEQDLYLFHTVQFSGETLGLISSWYTGKTNLWQEVLKHNPGLDIRKIELGSIIKIPRAIAIKDKPMPRKFIPRKQPVVQVDVKKEVANSSNSVIDESAARKTNDKTEALIKKENLSVSEIKPAKESLKSIEVKSESKVDAGLDSSVNVEKGGKLNENSDHSGKTKILDTLEVLPSPVGDDVDVKVKTRYELLQEMLN